MKTHWYILLPVTGPRPVIDSILAFPNKEEADWAKSTAELRREEFGWQVVDWAGLVREFGSRAAAAAQDAIAYQRRDDAMFRAKTQTEKTLADHAEEWQRERRKFVPLRNSPSWKAMYEEWIEFAFAGIGSQQSAAAGA